MAAMVTIVTREMIEKFAKDELDPQSADQVWEVLKDDLRARAIYKKFRNSQNSKETLETDSRTYGENDEKTDRQNTEAQA